MDYSGIKSNDPKWAQVQIGQFAVVRLDDEGDVVTVYSVESSRQHAIAFARSVGLGSTNILHRETGENVETIRWN